MGGGQTWLPVRPPKDFTCKKNKSYSLPQSPPEENYARFIHKFVLNRGDLEALDTTIEPYSFQTCYGKDRDGDFPPY